MLFSFAWLLARVCRSLLLRITAVGLGIGSAEALYLELE
jgi:hypothetical protein